MRRSPSFAGAILCALACVAVSTATAQTAAPQNQSGADQGSRSQQGSGIKGNQRAHENGAAFETQIQ
jgi:hypothetical protein